MVCRILPPISTTGKHAHHFTPTRFRPLNSQLCSVGGSPPFTPDDNAPTNTNEPYLSFLDFVNDQESIPQTFSTSYGDDEQTVPRDYAMAVCDGFAKLGARGSSVLFSSGDFGVGGGSCLSNDGKNRTEFIPIFPASCTCSTPRISRVTHCNELRPFRDVRRGDQRNCSRTRDFLLWGRVLELLQQTVLPIRGG